MHFVKVKHQLGATFQINVDSTVNLDSFEFPLSPEMKECHDILINNDMKRIQAISSSTHRIQSVVGDIFFHPTCFAVCGKAFTVQNVLSAPNLSEL